jgi:hypothetical protein
MAQEVATRKGPWHAASAETFAGRIAVESEQGLSEAARRQADFGRRLAWAVPAICGVLFAAGASTASRRGIIEVSRPAE